MTNNRVEIGQDPTGQWRWGITNGGPWTDPKNIIAVGPLGFDTEHDCLNGFFTIFFGTWDESFLEKYGEWIANSGGQAPYDIPPEAQEGANVRIEPEKRDDAAVQTAGNTGDGELVMSMVPKDVDAPGDNKPTPDLIQRTAPSKD